MDNLNLAQEKASSFFNNPGIDYQHKLILLATLLNGTTSFYDSNNENAVMVNFFNEDKTPKITICYSFGNSNSLAENNANLFLNVIGKGNEIGKIFNKVVSENQVNASDAEIFEEIVKQNSIKLNAFGMKSKWDESTEENVRTFMTKSKSEYPEIMTDEFINNFEQNYLNAIEGLKDKKKELTSNKELNN